MRNPASSRRRGQSAGFGDLDNPDHSAAALSSTTHAPDPLSEPIEVAKFFKNRRKDVIVVSLSTFEGRHIVDVRQHFTNDHGQNRPTTKGVAMVVQRLPDLHKAIGKALDKARELHLIREDA